MGMDAIPVYLEQINRAVAKGDATEHRHRPALKGLIEMLGKMSLWGTGKIERCK